MHNKFRKMSVVTKVVQLKAATWYDKTSPLVPLFTIKNKAVSTQKLLLAAQWILFFMTNFGGRKGCRRCGFARFFVRLYGNF